MLFSRMSKRVKLSVSVNLETAKCLKDLVRYYQMPLDHVVEALVVQDHESIKWPEEKLNPFIMPPKYLDLDR